MANQPEINNPNSDFAAKSDSAVSKDHKSLFRLDFNERAEDHLVNFYEPETSGEHVFRWSEPLAMVRMTVPANDYEVVIETESLRGEKCPFSFKLFWNDQIISRSLIRIERGQISFRIDRSMFIRNDEQRLTISCKPLTAENGRRKLGMPVKWIRMSQVGEQSFEFSNPSKSRSRMWRQSSSFKVRRLIGMKAPSPNLPIWEMKLPDVPSMLPVEQNSDSPPQSIDTVVISSVEINSRHGTGLLIQYMFEDFRNIATVSSQRCFHGDRVRSGVHYEVPFEEVERHVLYNMVLEWFKDAPPKQAYVVPFYKTELLVGIALNDLFQTKVCLHVMDDQCLYEDEISEELMLEAMNKASLVMTISPEMKAAYQDRFGKRAYILPPIVPESMILKKQDLSLAVSDSPQRQAGLAKRILNRVPGLSSKASSTTQRSRGILIGNVWDPKWLEMLQETISGSGVEVDWYSNNPDNMMLNGKREELAKAGIHLQDPLWGDDLVHELRRRPFAIMPSGTLCKDEPRESVARLSLPSRVPFVTTVSQIPIIVLGSRETAAGQFVTRFELGAVVDYDSSQFRTAVDYVMETGNHSQIRQNAARVSPVFSASGLREWLWQSVRVGQPIDSRFEDLFSEQNASPGFFDEANQPVTSYWPKEELHRVLRRLKSQGIQPARIIDIGARDGVWSSTVSKIFPDSHFVMIEPMVSRFSEQSRKIYQKSFQRFDFIEASISDNDQVCESRFSVGPRTDGRQLLNILGERQGFENSQVKVCRLDQLASENSWTGSTILRIDVSFAEHLVIGGGMDFIDEHVDIVMLELTLNRKHPSAKTYREILEIMHNIGFDLHDEMESRRCVKTGQLLQKNAVFLKKEWQADLQAA